MLTDLRHDSRAHKRVVVLAAGTLAVATLSSVAPVPQVVSVASASGVATAQSATAVQSDAATLDLTAAGVVAGTATAKAVAGAAKAVAAVPAPAPKKRAAPKHKATVRATALVAPYAFGTAAYAQWHAKHLMVSSRYGWKSSAQFVCLVNLWTRESHWNYRSHNKSSGAHGIPQAMPGAKMRIAGTDWLTNPVTQIRWGLGYIQGRYGSPCGAWSHFRSHSWY